MKPKYYISVWILTLLLILGALLPAVQLFRRGDDYGLLYSIPGILLACVTAAALHFSRRDQLRHIARLSEETDKAEQTAIRKLPAGLCLLDENGVLVWHNTYFQEQVMGGTELFGRNLYEMLPFDPAAAEQDVFWQQRYYHISSLPCEEEGVRLTAYLWQDVTELEELRLEHENSRPCVLLIVIDSYEDLIQNAKESERLAVGAAVEKLMEDLAAETGGVVRRLKNGYFFAVLEEQHVQTLIAGKFKLLDDARSILVNGRSPVTLSVGVGHGAANMQESEAFAVQCLDMAMGRGGDQAAVKTENGYRFFGGVSKGVEKKSRAKIRIVAGAVQDLIQECSNVIIMGHRFGDLDSVGGACGLAGAVRLMGVPVHVAVDPEKNLSQQLIQMVSREIGEELFLTPEEALEQLGKDSLLIIVDTHNKDILESPALYRAAKRVVVIDHHRKNVNFVDDAVVFHHEPYASSACEMISELLQYFRLPEAVGAVYADCLLAGIMLDTKNFVMRTGVRTFEAAAYLRKLGADTVRVKGLFSGSIEAYRSRTEIVGSAALYDCYAIAVAPPETPDVRLVAPQAADELLGISKVEAAFVIYQVNGIVNISARSYGAVNVQVIMEQLGGGGHQTMAATQIEGISLQDAKAELLQVIRTQGG